MPEFHRLPNNIKYFIDNNNSEYSALINNKITYIKRMMTQEEVECVAVILIFRKNNEFDLDITFYNFDKPEFHDDEGFYEHYYVVIKDKHKALDIYNNEKFKDDDIALFNDLLIKYIDNNN